MTTYRYLFLLALGFAYCAGCGSDSSSQPWDKAKSPPAAANAGPKSEPGIVKPSNVADNVATSDSGSGSGGATAGHGTTSPQEVMMMPDEASVAVPKNDGTLEIGKLQWTVPKTWVRKAPGMMLLAEYAVPKADGDQQDARLTVSQFGGSVDNNIDRWKHQFSKKLDKEKQETFDIGGVKTTLIDLSGTFDDSRGPMTPAVTRPDYGMLAAVVEVRTGRGC